MQVFFRLMMTDFLLPLEKVRPNFFTHISLISESQSNMLSKSFAKAISYPLSLDCIALCDFHDTKIIYILIACKYFCNYF